MKNQRMRQLQSLRALASVAIVALLLALCVCALSLSAFAQSPSAEGGVASLDFAEGVGVFYDPTAKYWGKTYDGTSVIDPEKVSLTVVGQTETKVPTVISAGFIAPNTADAQKDVGVARLYIVYEWDGVEREYTAPARIEKRLLTWKELSLNVRFTYDPVKTSYVHTFGADELSSVTLAALDGVLPEDADRLSLGAVSAVTLSAAEAVESLTAGTSRRTYASCVLSGAAAANYTLAGIEVDVAVDPCKITEVIWGIDGVPAEDALVFAYGDRDAYLVSAVGKIGEGEYRELIVKVKGADVTLDRADLATYGDVREAPYVLYAESANPAFFVLDGSFEANVTIERAECVISAADATFTKDAEHSPEFYAFPIQNPENNVPAEVFARIGYKFTVDGVNFVDSIGEVGDYTVQFFLHPDDEARYTLRIEETGEVADGKISVTVLPYRLTVGTEAGRADVILYNDKSDLGGILASVAVANDLPEKLLKKFTVYRALSLTVSGTDATDSLRLILPVHSELFTDAGTNALTAQDLYVLVGGELKSAKELYTVTLSEDGSYYTVSGIVANGTELSMTLLIAPEAPVSFWATAPGIALIVFLVLLFVMALILIGVYLRRMERREKNPTVTIDPEGGAAKPHPVEAPEKLGSADECLEEGLDALANSLEGSVAAEKTAETPADALSESAAALKETLNDAAAISLKDDSEERAIAEAEKLTEAMAEEKAKEFLASEEPAKEETVADAEELEGAVADTIGETLDSARAEAAVATFAADESLPHLRETVDAAVVEALAAIAKIPAGLREIESADAEDAADVSAQVERSVGEALRAIGSVSLKDGVDASAIERAVNKAADGAVPSDWNGAAAKELKDALSKALKSRLLK